MSCGEGCGKAVGGEGPGVPVAITAGGVAVMARHQTHAALCAGCGRCERWQAQVLAGTCPQGWAPDQRGLVWWGGIWWRGVPWPRRVALAVRRRRWGLVKALPGCGCIDRLKGWTEAAGRWWGGVLEATGRALADDQAELCRGGVPGEW